MTFFLIFTAVCSSLSVLCFKDPNCKNSYILFCANGQGGYMKMLYKMLVQFKYLIESVYYLCYKSFWVQKICLSSQS